MRTIDLTPLFRSTVGFDHMARLLDSAMSLDEGTSSYPPYNIEKLNEEKYRITMALAGFRPENLKITTRERLLLIEGQARLTPEGISYIYRGIAGRAFEKRFQLADSIKVLGSSLEDGILYIDLVREIPEELKPRVITIERRDSPEGTKQKMIDHRSESF